MHTDKLTHNEYITHKFKFNQKNNTVFYFALFDIKYYTISNVVPARTRRNNKI